MKGSGYSIPRYFLKTDVIELFTDAKYFDVQVTVNGADVPVNSGAGFIQLKDPTTGAGVSGEMALGYPNSILLNPYLKPGKNRISITAKFGKLAGKPLDYYLSPDPNETFSRHKAFVSAMLVQGLKEDVFTPKSERVLEAIQKAGAPAKILQQKKFQYGGAGSIQDQAFQFELEFPASAFTPVTNSHCRLSLKGDDWEGGILVNGTPVVEMIHVPEMKTVGARTLVENSQTLLKPGKNKVTARVKAFIAGAKKGSVFFGSECKWEAIGKTMGIEGKSDISRTAYREFFNSPVTRTGDTVFEFDWNE